MPIEFSPPRAAYVHVPFCRHRCGYCNFTLVAGRDDLIDDFMRAVAIELRAAAGPHEVDTLFVGGGTPTHLPAEVLRSLLASVKATFPLAPHYEFSVEANPDDLDASTIAALSDCGVTRLSIGGQSFNGRKLDVLQRDHTPQQLTDVVAAARERFASVSLDLIFGVPGESADVWSGDLNTAIKLKPHHVSTYGLTYERGTPFWKRLLEGEIGPLGEETERAMYATAIDTLTAAGFEHYEVSNFARAGHRCRHNETYWSGGGYFAVGPGAASYVDGCRRMNHRSTTTWLKRVLAGQSPVAESETLEPDDRAREYLVFALRRLEGVERSVFLERTGRRLDELVGGPLRKFVELGLLVDDGHGVRLSREGLFVSDSIWPRFLQA